MTGRIRVRAALPLVVAAGVMGLAACESTGPEDGGRVSVFLTDAPGDVESAWIRIDGIVLVGETENQEVELDGDFDSYIEVSDLVGRAQQLVASQEVSLETISQVRLMLGDAVLVTEQGEVYATSGAELPDGVDADEGDVRELHCPSCTQTGIKVVITGPRPDLEDENATLLIDFDVTQSFGKQAGQSGRWVMRPVVHASLSAVPGDPLAGSTITGTVSLASDAGGTPLVTIPQCPIGVTRAITDFVPTATAETLVDAEGNAIVRSGVVNADGTFTINAVNADSYDMGFLNVDVGDALGGLFRLSWTATASPADVTVGASGDHTVNYMVTGVSCVTL